jgi:hypothetical protein
MEIDFCDTASQVGFPILKSFVPNFREDFQSFMHPCPYSVSNKIHNDFFY